MNNDTALLSVKGLRVSADGSEILHSVNLEVGRGEIHVIMGPNGAGKSTLGNALMGSPEYEVTDGTITFEGKDVTHASADERSRAGMFMSFQNPLEVPGVTLAGFIRTAAESRTGEREKYFQFRKRLDAAMKDLDMDPSYADRDLNVGFSGGEKKKAEILQMLMLRPSLAILDETDSGLDVDAVRKVSEAVEKYVEETRGSLLIVTHSTRILESLKVDRTHVLVDGRIVADGDGSLVGRINEEGFEPFLKGRAMSQEERIAEVDRSRYDFRYEEKDSDFFRMGSGLSREIVEEISDRKDDPEWMREFRLKCLGIYNKMEMPDWGPSIEGLDVDHISSYVAPKTGMSNTWEDVPKDIKETFEKLGIPEAERKSLAGVGAQYDSELVYHNVKDEVAKQGVVYTDLESAMKGEYADMIRDHFMHLVPPTDHKFAALHGAVWSGGSFVYVPKGVHLDIPLQSYFRLNSKGAGQFEHTLIIVDEGASLHFIEGCSAPKYNVANLHAGCVELFVGKGAKLRYSTIENWSKNMYNLNTKRAKVEEGGAMEWVSGSFGSHVSYLYPMTILAGRDSACDFTGVTFAGEGQDLDTGCKVVHVAPHTRSHVSTRSISKDGGVSTFRSAVVIERSARDSKSSVSCQSLMLDDRSRSDTIPAMDVKTDRADVGHEARIGRISDDAVFYLMSRGLSEEDARAMIVTGFAGNVSKELPLEYAVEMNNLIRLEMKRKVERCPKARSQSTGCRLPRGDG